MLRELLGQIKEHPAHSFGQLIKIIFLIIVSLLSFLFGIGVYLLMVVYIALLVLHALKNIGGLRIGWWKYLAAAVVGCGLIKLLGVILSGLLAKVREDLLVSAFGQTSENDSGGAVPQACIKPFDTKETALLELRQKFDVNVITEEEYEKQKKEISNDK